MAVDGNGRETEPSSKGANGHAVAPRFKGAKAKKGLSLLSIFFRLLTWYSIITVLFRCPASVDLLTDSTPKICKPYFQVRSAIAPHLEPYYDEYAAPYVDSARPYYDTLNENVITPVTALGAKYGAPRVAQAQAYGQAQWDKNLQPQVLKFQELATEQYNQHLAPHIEKATVALAPYYDIARTNALQTYYEHLLPAYTTVQPYAIQSYDIASNFTVNTAIPYSQWAVTTTGNFLERTVYPKLRILYGENVEPQLVKISERLGRYRDGKKLQSIVDEIDSSSSASSISSRASSAATSISSTQAQTASPSSVTEESTSTSAEDPTETTSLTDAEIREKAQKIVAEDLKTWQEKFAKAADEGSEYLQEHITEITDRLVKNQAEKVGEALNIQLEEKVLSSLDHLKKTIISIVESSKDNEEKEDDLKTAVRKAGVGIKEKAQAVRTWRQSFDREVNSLVSKSAEDTFEILDHIRDLGLQEIGMRWAWTDGITHKDWAKYHKLKTKFDEWRLDVEKVVSEHVGVAKAKAASEDVESKAMGTAEGAARELARLRETGRWKISTGDTSDDWTTKVIPAAAAILSEKIKGKLNEASEAVLGASHPSVESVVSVASSAVADDASKVADGGSKITSWAASQVSEAESIASDLAENATSSAAAALFSAVGSEPQEVIESVIADIDSAIAAAESALAAASAKGISPENEDSSSEAGALPDPVKILISAAAVSASSVPDKASSSTINITENFETAVSSAETEASSLATEASSSVVEAAERASSSLKSTTSVVSEEASIPVDEATAAVSSASSIISGETSEASVPYESVSSSESKKVWGGAVAQSVEAKKIILDDVIEDHEENLFSEKIQSMASEAGDRFADVTKAVSEALHRPTGKGDLVETVTILAAEQYSSALHAASVALYGTERGAAESVASVVTSRYADAVAAASSVVFGTASPLTSSIAAAATQAYNDAVSRASENYEHARSLVSAKISGTPKPAHEEMLSSVENAYSGAVSAAHDRLQDALASVSSAYYGPPQGALESVSSVAASKLSEGLISASALFAEGKSYASAVSTGSPEKKKLLAQLQDQYHAGVGLAHARYTEFLNAASSAIPTQKPTPWADSVASAASSNWEALVTKASSEIYGQPTPDFVTRNLLSEAGQYAAFVADNAASQYSAVQSLVGELVAGKEPDFAQSAFSRLSSAYVAGAAEANSYASSYASDAYASATSALNTIFTPPPAIEAIIEAAQSRFNEAVEAASIQIYGTPKGAYEQATSSVASAYSSVQSALSEKVYGTKKGYAEVAQSSIAEAAASASRAISEAIYGKKPTPTGAYMSATSVANEAYSTASSYLDDSYSKVSSRLSSAIYGPEQGAVESAQKRVGEAVESARAKLASFVSAAADAASSAASRASEGVEEFASNVGSAVDSATSHLKKDEL